MGKHYVPQRYLQGFSSPEDTRQIWMYDKKAQSWAFAAIKRVAQEKDYYPPEIEARLKRLVEDTGNEALGRLRNRDRLTADEQKALINYIGVMMMRVPRKRRLGYERVPSVLDNTMKNVREEIEELATDLSPGRLSELLAQIDEIQGKYENELPNEVRQQIHSPWPSEKMLAALHNMCWRIVPAPALSLFITTDNPAFYFDAYGVGTRYSEVTFPVSSDLALLGSHQGPPGTLIVVQPKSTLIKEINRRLASGAERFVFSKHRAQWIETISNRRNPYLRRIVWQ